MITDGFSILAFLTYPLLPIIAGFVILRRRNRIDPADRAPGVIYLTQIIGASAAGWAAFIAIGHAIVVFQPSTAIDAFANVSAFEPWSSRLEPGALDSGSAYVIFADIDVVRVAVAQADIGTQLLQVLGGVMTQLPTIAVGFFVMMLCERIITGAPFAAQLSRLSWIGAGVFLVTGFAGQLVSDLAAYRLAELAFDLIGPDNPGLTLPTPIWPTGLDLWPLWGALALAVLAVLIRHGIRLQRETEGLV